MVEEFMVEGFMVEGFMVEGFMVEGFMIEKNYYISSYNVCFKKTWTNYSTVSLLCFVQVFLKQTLVSAETILF